MAMKICALLLLLAYFAALGDTQKENKNLDDGDVEHIFNCFKVVFCDLKRNDEVYRVSNAAGPILRASTCKAYSKCYLGHEIPEEEVLTRFDEIVCPHTKEKKRQCFIEVMKEVGLVTEMMCSKAIFDADARMECEKAEASVMEAKDLVQEHTLNGDCFNPASIVKQD